MIMLLSSMGFLAACLFVYLTYRIGFNKGWAGCKQALDDYEKAKDEPMESPPAFGQQALVGHGEEEVLMTVIREGVLITLSGKKFLAKASINDTRLANEIAMDLTRVDVSSGNGRQIAHAVIKKIKEAKERIGSDGQGQDN